MRTCSLFVLVLFGLHLWNAQNPEQLLREGHQALAQGDYERAAALYQQAELRSTNPAEIAFYLAEAKYRLAVQVEGLSSQLLEAEQLYRCCLDPSDPHRPYALCGLGNCLLRKAGSSDEDNLRSALACYDLCLQSAGDDEVLISAVRYNREKARLMLLQFLPSTRDSTRSRPSGSDPSPHRLHSKDKPPTLPSPADTESIDRDANPPSVAPDDVRQRQIAEAAKNNELPQPGKGNLPPIPDEVDVPPLPPQLADEYLEQAARKVLQERQERQRRKEETADKDVKDW